VCADVQPAHEQHFISGLHANTAPTMSALLSHTIQLLEDQDVRVRWYNGESVVEGASSVPEILASSDAHFKSNSHEYSQPNDASLVSINLSHMLAYGSAGACIANVREYADLLNVGRFESPRFHARQAVAGSKAVYALRRASQVWSSVRHMFLCVKTGEICSEALAEVLEGIQNARTTNAVVGQCIGIAVTAQNVYVAEYTRKWKDKKTVAQKISIRRVSVSFVLPLWLMLTREGLACPGLDIMEDGPQLYSALQQLGLDPACCSTQLLAASGNRIYQVSLLNKYTVTTATGGEDQAVVGCPERPDFAVKIFPCQADYQNEVRGLKAVTVHYAASVRRHHAQGLSPPSCKHYAVAAVECQHTASTGATSGTHTDPGASGSGGASDWDIDVTSSGVGNNRSSPRRNNAKKSPRGGKKSPRSGTKSPRSSAQTSIEAVKSGDSWDDTEVHIIPSDVAEAAEPNDTEQSAEESLGRALAAATEFRERLSSGAPFTVSKAPSKGAEWCGGAIIMHVGDPIEKWLASSTLSREQQVRELLKWGSISLSAAHAGGILHRDVRLSNFLWVCGAIQLIDFNFSAPVGTPVVLSDGAIFDCRPVGMAGRSVGDSVEWREADDMSMLASMCLDFTSTT
jgi:hypothetical protein